LTTGTAFIMWLGEQITERGIGNGMSLIIFTGIVVGLPAAIVEMVTKVQTGDWNALQVIIILAMMIAVVGFIVLVERGERRIPVQYAKRVIGRMPERPAIKACQFFSTPVPSGETTPSPVTTTLRCSCIF